MSRGCLANAHRLWLLPLQLTLIVAGAAWAQHTQPAPTQQANKTGEGAMKITIRSTAFEPGKQIPKKYTGEGEDLSPPLTWSGAPAETKEFALICDDPDAPRPEPWVHWVIYGIPGKLSGLPEGLPNELRLPNLPAVQGKNTWNKVGYNGAMPPPGHGVHRYYFKLYALDAELKLQPGLTKDELLKQIKPHVIAEGELVGTYQR